MVKKLRIAVIGARSSGKSYLLYDMIHAFEQLGYVPEELPLSYPHSSFGAYFYDTFNDATGGMKGTDRYACRPESHYGAYMSKRPIGRTLAVDFLNIPGEVFDRSSDRMSQYFELKRLIEKKGKGLFWLQEWQSPSKHTVRLIVPNGFTFNNLQPVKPNHQRRYGNYMQWDNILYELNDGKYALKRSKTVSGRYMLRHLTELNTDSVLLTIETCWNQITLMNHLDKDDYKAHLVLHYFYPLHFCEKATDIIICDKLTDQSSAGMLAESIAHYIDMNKRNNPNVYVAFRGADLLLNNYPPFSNRNYDETLAQKPYQRNELYSQVASRLKIMLHSGEEESDGIYLSDNWRQHILQTVGHSIGNSFWHLLNASVGYGSLKHLMNQIRGAKSVSELSEQPQNVLPPHVYFTSTPIDTHLRIYKSDPEDVTRFYSNDGGHFRSFNQVIRHGNSKHLCFGSYQLLTDLLWQNGVLSEGLRARSELLKYAQSKL